MGTNSGAYELNHECASTHQSELLCCCEPFLNGTFCDYVISLDNYSLFRRDRGSNGGGLTKINYHCSGRSNLEFKILKCIWLEIKLQHNKPFIVLYI